MRTELTQEEIASYRENGFVVIHDFLTDSELKEWRESVGEAVENRGEARLPGEEGKAFQDLIQLFLRLYPDLSTS